jgi:Domain of unknown function (DUF4352)
MDEDISTVTENKPKKLTVSLVARWIFGILFLIGIIGALGNGSPVGALFLFIAAIVSIPPTSQAIESTLNFSLSGALRFVIVLVLLVVAGAASPHNNQNVASANNVATPDNNVNVPSSNIPSSTNTNVCDWDWKYVTTSSIGDYNKAPSGSHYAIVSIYLKNNADNAISTNPLFWSFTADGIKYTSDAATFDQSIHSQSVDVGKGGEMETQIVYLVKGTPTNAVLAYTGFGQPDMQRISHY